MRRSKFCSLCYISTYLLLRTVDAEKIFCGFQVSKYEMWFQLVLISALMCALNLLELGVTYERFSSF
jgi:hypothetical protein